MRGWTKRGHTTALAAVWVVGLLWSAGRAAAADFAHVRSQDATVRDLVRTGYERSATFKTLVDEIDSGPVIVYIERVVKLSRGMAGALLHVAAGSSEIRLLRIVIKFSLAGDRAVAIVAHELQHVVEVLRAGRLKESSIAETFAALDPDAADAKFETPEARAIEAQVFQELRSKSRR